MLLLPEGQPKRFEGAAGDSSMRGTIADMPFLEAIEAAGSMQSAEWPVKRRELEEIPAAAAAAALRAQQRSWSVRFHGGVARAGLGSVPKRAGQSRVVW